MKPHIILLTQDAADVAQAMVGKTEVRYAEDVMHCNNDGVLQIYPTREEAVKERDRLELNGYAVELPLN